jgi:hypothetical protein
MAATINATEAFILSYFDQNPLSQIGMIITRDSVAEKLTELSGKQHLVLGINIERKSCKTHCRD